MVLVNANGKVGQMGALADFLEVEPKYERAVEACLGDLLQHVVVERLDHVSAGLKLIRQENAGRCGFIVGRPDDGSAVATYSGDGGGLVRRDLGGLVGGADRARFRRSRFPTAPWR